MPLTLRRIKHKNLEGMIGLTTRTCHAILSVCNTTLTTISPSIP